MVLYHQWDHRRSISGLHAMKGRLSFPGRGTRVSHFASPSDGCSVLPSMFFRVKQRLARETQIHVPLFESFV